MRVIAGKAGGIPLQVPKSLTRPTTDRVREAIFSSLGSRVIDAEVLDLYAGSGALGIEALSRGARLAVFVDDDRKAIESIEANLAKAKLPGGTVSCRSVLGFLGRLPQRFDLVFADPPYARDEARAVELANLLGSAELAAAVRDGGGLVLESLAKAPLPDSVHWSVDRERTYGGTRVSFLTKGGQIAS